MRAAWNAERVARYIERTNNKDKEQRRVPTSTSGVAAIAELAVTGVPDECPQS